MAAALATFEAVVAQGRLYPKEMLDQALTCWRAHFESLLYDAVVHGDRPFPVEAIDSRRSFHRRSCYG